MEDAPSTPNVETEFDPCDQDLLVLTNEEIESVSNVGEKAADIEKAIKLISTIVPIQARQPADIFWEAKVNMNPPMFNSKTSRDFSFG